MPIKLSDNQKSIILQLGDSLHTVEFMEHWINRDDNVMINAPAALQAAEAKGFYRAILAIEQHQVYGGHHD